MTTPPATCPACGSSFQQRSNGLQAFYDCGTLYYFKDGQWLHANNQGWYCRNAFDIAGAAEIERLKAQLALCEEALAFDELDAQPEELKE